MKFPFEAIMYPKFGIFIIYKYIWREREREI